MGPEEIAAFATKDLLKTALKAVIHVMNNALPPASRLNGVEELVVDLAVTCFDHLNSTLPLCIANELVTYVLGCGALCTLCNGNKKSVCQGWGDCVPYLGCNEWGTESYVNGNTEPFQGNPWAGPVCLIPPPGGCGSPKYGTRRVCKETCLQLTGCKCQCTGGWKDVCQ